MGRSFPRQLLVLISVVTFLFDRLIASDFCSCTKKHPQTMFCEADFVIQVLRRNTRTYVRQRYPSYGRQEPWLNPHTSQFYVRIKRIYKGHGYFLNTRSIKLHTPTAPSCSASITANKPYIVSGRFRQGSPTISKCTWVTPLRSLAKRFRRILRKGRFTSQCNRCKIEACEGSECRRNHGTCSLDLSKSDFECYMRHTYCRANSRFGRCGWAKSRNKLQACQQHMRRNEDFYNREYPTRK